MSYSATLDNKLQTGGDVASNNGWNRFREWVESRNAEIPQLRHLVEFGWCQHLDILLTDLGVAVGEGVDADNLSVARGIGNMLLKKADAETIVISDGT